MDFVAIDFETATSQWTSICSMGICVVEDNKITETAEFLIRPEPFEFNEYNIAIHGITPEMVQNKPRFEELWPKIKPYIDNKTIIAHNASFDVGALHKTLDSLRLEPPTFDYICTVKLSQKAYPELKSHKLNLLGEALGIDFRHHNACEDAYACAMIFLHILEDFGINSLEELEERFEIGIGRLCPGLAEPCRKNKKLKKSG